VIAGSYSTHPEPETDPAMGLVDWTGASTRHLLFTGKGGVGKTTIGAATAVALADQGQRVLVVSTDPASNLDDVFATPIGQDPTPIPHAPGLFAINIDPEAAAAAYRDRTLAPYRGVVPPAELASLEEQLSGQCTLEIAAFDQFSLLLASPDTTTAAFDHIIFDTAPTGHTLRLLALPAAWSTYLETTPAAASCLGPLASLEGKRDLYEDTVAVLGDPAQTTVVLVSRADRSSLREAARAAAELAALGVTNQRLVLNGLLETPLPGDPVAAAFADRQRTALAAVPSPLAALPTTKVALVASDLTGIDALRALVDGRSDLAPATEPEAPASAGIGELIDELDEVGSGVVMVMGKGGVGKTTVAATIAVALARRGRDVHLATTDPAGGFTDTLDEHPPATLTVSRIDPAAEVRRYVDKKLNAAANLDPERRALLEEDLRSPCTEELAVFQAFSRLLREGEKRTVIIDTAPSGHTLLLLDRTGAYHRDVMRGSASVQGKITTPLMRIQDRTYTRVLLVTLAEATPVQEAAELQADLRRAGIEPYGWVINASLSHSGTHDPVLARRAALEHRHIHRVQSELAARTWLLPWLADANSTTALAAPVP